MNYATTGLSLPSVLTIVFVALKLVGVLTWPWVWVLSPLWITLLICGLWLAVLFGMVWASRS